MATTIMITQWIFLLLMLLLALFRLYYKERRKERRRDYYRNTYLKSDAWRRKRYVVLKRDEWTCVHCGAKANEVHHKKYARNIGREPIHWLESVCERCHRQLHGKR